MYVTLLIALQLTHNRLYHVHVEFVPSVPVHCPTLLQLYDADFNDAKVGAVNVVLQVLAKFAANFLQSAKELE